mmetsp:Transcript_2362/g.10805  ORF Transcript_2362/g.10805 Transcript_2362/m.10805 type:complete len:246 (-) Transcript_2362:481-1218(-)
MPSPRTEPRPPPPTPHPDSPLAVPARLASLTARTVALASPPSSHHIANTVKPHEYTSAAAPYPELAPLNVPRCRFVSLSPASAPSSGAENIDDLALGVRSEAPRRPFVPHSSRSLSGTYPRVPGALASDGPILGNRCASPKSPSAASLSEAANFHPPPSVFAIPALTLSTMNTFHGLTSLCTALTTSPCISCSALAVDTVHRQMVLSSTWEVVTVTGPFRLNASSSSSRNPRASHAVASASSMRM